jgi:arabinofuranosyltransferase
LLARKDIAPLALRAAPLVVIGLALVWHSLRYDFVTDDAYISFVYSRNLAEHGQLTFNLGMPPVEGYTNFLWTALLGGLMTVGLRPEVTSLVLGTGFALATLVVVWRLTAHLADGEGPWDYLGPALLALTAGYACWASGGLETQMFTFFVLLAVYLAARRDAAPRAFRHVGWVLALAAMTRPEGLLVTAVIGAHRLVWNAIGERRVKPCRDELIAAAGFLALWAPWFAWRWWYYGWPFPNTYYVKAAGAAVAGYEGKMRAAGLYYVGQWLRQTDLRWLGPLAVVGWLVAPLGSRRLRAGTLAVALMAVYLVYAVRVGGDFMGLHRFIMPVTVLALVGVALGLRTVIAACARALPVGAPRVALAVVAAAALVAGVGWRQLALTAQSMRPGNYRNDHGIDTPAFLAVYAHDRARIGQAMRGCFRPDDFAIYGGVGAKPYYAQLRGIDVFGLVSSRIAHEVPRTVARAGHNKFAPDRVLAELDPTFVFSCYDLHRDPKRPHWNCNPGFWKARGYQQVTMRIPGLIERGEYYSFMVKTERAFDCPGVVSRSP